MALYISFNYIAIHYNFSILRSLAMLSDVLVLVSEYSISVRFWTNACKSRKFEVSVFPPPDHYIC